MRLRYLFAIFGIIFSSTVSYAKSPIDKYLSTLKIFENEDGRYIKTFEDVTINFNPFQDRNKKYPIVNKQKIPDDYVNKETAHKYFKDFSSHAILTDEDTTFKEFMDEHFYLTNINNELKLVTFPFGYNITNPGTNTFYLCMDSNYEYVKKFREFSPDALSCRSCKSLCDNKCTSSNHKYGKNNIYSNFKEAIFDKSYIAEAEEVKNEDNFINIYCIDRTPPQIDLYFTQLSHFIFLFKN